MRTVEGNKNEARKVTQIDQVDINSKTSIVFETSLEDFFEDIYEYFLE